MSIFSKIGTATVAASLLTVSVLAGAANAAPIAPQKAELLLRNPNPGGCTNVVTVAATVSAKQPGEVALRLERKKTGAVVGLGWLHIGENKNYKKAGRWQNEKYIGQRKFNAPLPMISFKEQYRVIASGPGKVLYGAWTKLVNKC